MGQVIDIARAVGRDAFTEHMARQKEKRELLGMFMQHHKYLKALCAAAKTLADGSLNEVFTYHKMHTDYIAQHLSALDECFKDSLTMEQDAFNVKWPSPWWTEQLTPAG